MEAFDVLNMGNILSFYLDHSNCYLFIIFPRPLYKSGKNSSNYKVHGTQNDCFNAKIGKEKYALGLEILAKRLEILTFFLKN